MPLPAYTAGVDHFFDKTAVLRRVGTTPAFSRLAYAIIVCASSVPFVVQLQSVHCVAYVTHSHCSIVTTTALSTAPMHRLSLQDHLGVLRLLLRLRRFSAAVVAVVLRLRCRLARLPARRLDRALATRPPLVAVARLTILVCRTSRGSCWAHRFRRVSDSASSVLGVSDSSLWVLCEALTLMMPPDWN